jgi:hypothetical protein
MLLERELVELLGVDRVGRKEAVQRDEEIPPHRFSALHGLCALSAAETEHEIERWRSIREEGLRLCRKELGHMKLQLALEKCNSEFQFALQLKGRYWTVTKIEVKVNASANFHQSHRWIDMVVDERLVGPGLHLPYRGSFPQESQFVRVRLLPDDEADLFVHFSHSMVGRVLKAQTKNDRSLIMLSFMLHDTPVSIPNEHLDIISDDEYDAVMQDLRCLRSDTVGKVALSRLAVYEPVLLFEGPSFLQSGGKQDQDQKRLQAYCSMWAHPQGLRLHARAEAMRSVELDLLVSTSELARVLEDEKLSSAPLTSFSVSERAALMKLLSSYIYVGSGQLHLLPRTVTASCWNAGVIRSQTIELHGVRVRVAVERSGEGDVILMKVVVDQQLAADLQYYFRVPFESWSHLGFPNLAWLDQKHQVELSSALLKCLEPVAGFPALVIGSSRDIVVSPEGFLPPLTLCPSMWLICTQRCTSRPALLKTVACIGFQRYYVDVRWCTSARVLNLGLWAPNCAHKVPLDVSLKDWAALGYGPLEWMSLDQALHMARMAVSWLTDGPALNLLPVRISSPAIVRDAGSHLSVTTGQGTSTDVFSEQWQSTTGLGDLLWLSETERQYLAWYCSKTVDIKDAQSVSHKGILIYSGSLLITRIDGPASAPMQVSLADLGYNTLRVTLHASNKQSSSLFACKNMSLSDWCRATGLDGHPCGGGERGESIFEESAQFLAQKAVHFCFGWGDFTASAKYLNRRLREARDFGAFVMQEPTLVEARDSVSVNKDDKQCTPSSTSKVNDSPGGETRARALVCLRLAKKVLLEIEAAKTCTSVRSAPMGASTSKSTSLSNVADSLLSSEADQGGGATICRCCGASNAGRGHGRKCKHTHKVCLPCTTRKQFKSRATEPQGPKTEESSGNEGSEGEYEYVTDTDDDGSVYECNNCQRGIVGLESRYHCIEGCDDYDLCPSCHAAGVHKHRVIRIDAVAM